MFNLELQKIVDEVIQNSSLDNLTPDQRVYFHQKLVDFAPFLAPESRVTLHWEQPLSSSQPMELTFQVQTFDVVVKSVATGDDFYQTLDRATSQLLEHLFNVRAEMIAEEHNKGTLGFEDKSQLH